MKRVVRDGGTPAEVLALKIPEGVGPNKRGKGETVGY